MDIDKNIGIYKITNLVNGKVYIGQSRNITGRKNNYKNLNCKGQRKLYNSIIKYGWDNFTFEVLCNCEIEDLNFWEYDYFMIYQQLLGKDMMLNLTAGGGACLYVSDETRIKMRVKKIKAVSIDQFYVCGEYIKTYTSYKDIISENAHIKQVYTIKLACDSNNNKLVYGYLWRYTTLT